MLVLVVQRPPCSVLNQSQKVGKHAPWSQSGLWSTSLFGLAIGRWRAYVCSAAEADCPVLQRACAVFSVLDACCKFMLGMLAKFKASAQRGRGLLMIARVFLSLVLSFRLWYASECLILHHSHVEIAELSTTRSLDPDQFIN